MNVRLRSSRAGVNVSYKPGEVVDLPEGQAKRLIELGEADPVKPGEPTWIPPKGWEHKPITPVADAGEVGVLAGPAPVPAQPVPTAPAAAAPPKAAKK
jgi:hypothetical protein